MRTAWSFDERGGVAEWDANGSGRAGALAARPRSSSPCSAASCCRTAALSAAGSRRHAPSQDARCSASHAGRRTRSAPATAPQAVSPYGIRRRRDHEEHANRDQPDKDLSISISVTSDLPTDIAATILDWRPRRFSSIAAVVLPGILLGRARQGDLNGVAADALRIVDPGFHPALVLMRSPTCQVERVIDSVLPDDAVRGIGEWMAL
jgi:hypothetical protein